MRYINILLYLSLCFIIIVNAIQHRDSFIGQEKIGMIDSKQLVDKLKNKIIEYEEIESNMEGINNSLIE